MKLSRRNFLIGSGAAAALASCGGKGKGKGKTTLEGPGTDGGDTQGSGVVSEVKPHHLVLVNLRGGYDSVLSVDPKDAGVVKNNIYCGYRADDRLKGAKRLYGPMIGGLLRHDSDLCLVHGIRTDTTSHLTGLQMYMRGARGLRPGPIAPIFAKALAGNAPMPVLNMMALSGALEFEAGERPAWADLRKEAHIAHAAELAQGPVQEQLVGATKQTAMLETFLDDARKDADSISGQFGSALGPHFRYAFQAIRGNWAKCIQIGTRLLSFDSHSDNDRFQAERMPVTFDDLATFLDLLKSTKNAHGTLFEQTTVVIFSEMGRYPQLNAEKGKDHWPESSWIMTGRGIKGGFTVGATDDRKLGLPINFASGQPKALADGGRPLFIDNGFAALLKLSGGELSSHGYKADSALDCILA